MRPHHLVLLAALSAVLASCQSMTPQERRAADESRCAGYGFKPRTEGMARCLLDLDLDRRAERRQWQNEINNRPRYWGPVIVHRPVVLRSR
ncbi:hypothetical protein ACQKKX_18705 [Neorhizobium sp. NPDC001467]|uniref:hypothetical protein n=1 Tax=Neorhizobium sp. NPDC001467 TaxID=3390595 RepID=UPI003CFFE6FE